MREVIMRLTPKEFEDAEHAEILQELVRCKDCKWIDLCKDPEYYEYKGANGFCSKGERMDEVGNGI